MMGALEGYTEVDHTKFLKTDQVDKAGPFVSKPVSVNTGVVSADSLGGGKAPPTIVEDLKEASSVVPEV